MKFSVGQASLARSISIVSRGMASSSTIPLLSGIYISAYEGTLELKTSNLTSSIRHRTAAHVEDPGEIVIAGKILSNIVKNLPKEVVTFEITGSTLNIFCKTSHFHLNTLNASDFPEFPSLSPDRSVELPVDTLGRLVDKVYRVTSSDPARPILSGILMNVTNQNVRLVATDAYRIAVCETAVRTPSLADTFEMIIPGSIFHDVVNLPQDEEMITIGFTENQIIFTIGNTTYITRKIEGKYPRYEQIFPKTSTYSATFNVQKFLSAFKRVSVVAVNNPSVKISLSSEEGLITLNSFSADQGEATETLPADIQGGETAIAFNTRYVLDCLSAAPTEEITLSLENAIQPGVFSSYGAIDYSYLLMPVRM